MAIDVSVQKRWSDFSLDVSFSSPGGIVGLLGASGCGQRPNSFRCLEVYRRSRTEKTGRLFISRLCALSRHDSKRKYLLLYSEKSG